ncbi:MAG: monovalent cation/H(+) antiporter subunit G [Candidatus Micrarchaeota archaeon]|nr:monovalent cation/H(+) antiporter subunit G [Candidatus Micrarchaeota archaeon]
MNGGIIAVLIGALISIIGSIGLVRFPDVFTRSHAQTVVNVGGVALMLIGAAFELIGDPAAWKIIVIIILIFVTSPTATHAITKAAYERKIH